VVAPAACLTVQTLEVARSQSGDWEGQCKQGEGISPTWARPLSKLGQNVSTNGLNSPDTYQPKYHICFIYFIFRYSLDTYPWRIRYVFVSDTYPSRIGEFGDVSVFCRWVQVLEISSCRNAGKCCVHKTQSGRTLLWTLCKRELRASGCPFS
jgi:hypothetical protein